MEQRRCQFITVDAPQQKSQVVVLAYHNQYKWFYERDYDGSPIAQGKLNTINAIVADQTAVVNGLYAGRFGPVDNITWDDFVKCKSELSPVKDADGKTMLDNDGNIVPDYMTRDTIAQLGYKFSPKNYPDMRPFKDSSWMKSAITYVPPSMDVKYPPELVVVFVLFVGLLVFLLLVGVVVALAGDDKPRRYYEPEWYTYQ